MTAIQSRAGAAAATASSSGDYTILRVAMWSVAAYAGLGLLGFAVFAGFWPPPAESLNAAEIAAEFRDHHTAIRIGMVLMAAGGPFYFVWSAVISRIISRMEGPMGVLSTVELIGGLFTALVTFLPPVIWVTAAFRLDARSDETISMLYDFGWFFFDLTFLCTFLQQLAVGVAILRDRRAQPLFPRWVAYLAFLTCLIYVPLSLLPFVRTGPFAWHGLLNFWGVFTLFFVFIGVVAFYGYRALRVLEDEDTVIA